MARLLSDLPSAVDRRSDFDRRLAGRRPAVFLDYDGTLTPIVERPEQAVLPESTRRIVRELAQRCPVAVVSGRDRVDVERLVGIDSLIFAGGHGFDIRIPGKRPISRQVGRDFAPLLEAVRRRLAEDLTLIRGAMIEPKSASVAVHYRQVDAPDRPRVRTAVEALLADHADLKVTPGKMVYELQPKVDWNKGAAVLWLLEAAGLAARDVLPLYFGDDITDEDAFRALSERGLGIHVGGVPRNAAEDRATAADFRLESPAETARFLDTLVR